MGQIIYKILKYSVGVTFISLLINYGNSYSYPKFAAYSGEQCMSCHVSPTGGAIRHLGGIKFSRENLYLKLFQKANKQTEFSSQITKGIQIGADVRTLFFDNQTGPGNADLNSFYQMEADIYVNAKINKYLNLVVAPSIQYMTFPPVYEVYGMVSNLPADLFIRAGKIKPNFGIKIPEHRAYQRFYNLNTPYNSDAGLEAGIAPGGLLFTAGLFNGLNNTITNDFDSDGGKELVLSADYRWASKKNKFTFDLGSSFLNNPFKYSVSKNINALNQIGAGFISIGLFERVAILGEFDYNRLKISDSVNTKRDFRTIFGEIDIRLIQGLEAKFQYENYDPQLGIKDGSLIRSRYSFGFEIYPLTGIEMETVFRLVTTPSGTKLHNNEFQQMIKFYF
jgi:hypothetical protein